MKKSRNPCRRIFAPVGFNFTHHFSKSKCRLNRYNCLTAKFSGILTWELYPGQSLERSKKNRINRLGCLLFLGLILKIGWIGSHPLVKIISGLIEGLSLFTVFASGMTTLALELTASRLLGSAFGTSNLVWASIIGLILIYLTVGYFLGGWLADRYPYPKTMYTILAWGAFIAGLIPLAAKPVIRLAADGFDQLRVGTLFGSFTAVLVLFSIPVVLLGTISPYAIRLAIQNPNEAGRVWERYAISTLGSFIGTFLPVLVMIRCLGRLKPSSHSVHLTLVALVGLWRVSGWRSAIIWIWMLIILLVAAFFWVGGPIKKTAGQIYETESAYNYIQVLMTMAIACCG